MSVVIPPVCQLGIGERSSETMHGLLVLVAQEARETRFFETLTDGLKVKMKVVVYTHQQKIETIVAGLAVGCRHIAGMQTSLVPDTLAAEIFGMARFADQSQINAFLRRFGPAQVIHLEQAHQALLEKYSLAADRTHWPMLADGRRYLPVDLDQTPIVTRSMRAKGTARGYFGRKRGSVGYKKSVAFLGGGVKEVLWQRLEPGDTHAQEAVPTILERLAALAKARGIARGEILGRGDSQYGTVKVARQWSGLGMHYLFKGYTPNASKRLADSLPATALWHFRGIDSNGSRVWVAEAGEQELQAQDDPPGLEPLKTRVVVQVRVAFRLRKKHGRGAPNQVPEKTITYEHYLTDLSAKALPVEPTEPTTIVEVYNARQTQERFFRSEQDALGADNLRTYTQEGEAGFLWLLASTVNLLRWTQRRLLARTELEEAGLTKLVVQAMQIPATITRTLVRTTRTWVITLPETARLARHLVSVWMERELQLPLPLDFVPNTT